jgi:hypothetical protein
VAGRLGYCGKDKRRAPLVGDEVRGCWDERTGVTFRLFEEALERS